MLNFSIKTPKKQLHQSFQMVKYLAYCYSKLVLIQAYCSLNCKKKKKKMFFIPTLVEGVGWLFVCSCFIIILMSSLYYLNEIVKNIEVLMFDIS